MTMFTVTVDAPAGQYQYDVEAECKHDAAREARELALADGMPEHQSRDVYYKAVPK